MNADLQKRVQRYGWDKAAEFYENSWQKQLKPAHDLLIKNADVQKGEHILDIAAGTGLITFRLAELISKSGKILATDISDEMVKIGNTLSKLKNASNIQFERMDAETLTCNSNSFDLITCALGLMYFPDPDNSANEMYRVLRSGGRAVRVRHRTGLSHSSSLATSRLTSR